MKKLQCEICGGSLMMQDGIAVCESCGMKFSKEEVKKMVVELSGPVEIKGPVELIKGPLPVRTRKRSFRRCS